MLEDPTSNPFLAQFYRDMRRYALPTQLFFLFQRVGQLESLKQPDLFARPTVADFTLAKDPLFARMTLDDAEYQLYSRILEHVKPQAPVPDLVIYLQASPEVLKKRLRNSMLTAKAAVDNIMMRVTVHNRASEPATMPARSNCSGGVCCCMAQLPDRRVGRDGRDRAGGAARE